MENPTPPTGNVAIDAIAAVTNNLFEAARILGFVSITNKVKFIDAITKLNLRLKRQHLKDQLAAYKAERLGASE